MNQQKKLMALFDSVAPHIPENRKIDWLENAEIIARSNTEKYYKMKDPKSNRDLYKDNPAAINKFEDKVVQELETYIKQISGFQPNEIGPLYLNYVGDYSMTSAGDIVSQKLATSYPEEKKSGLIVFGKMKSHAMEEFLFRMGDKFPNAFGNAKLAVEHMFKNGGWEDHPWIKEPDLKNYFLGVHVSGKSYLVEAVCPRTQEGFLKYQEGITEESKAKLAFIRLIINEAFRREPRDPSSEPMVVDRVAVAAYSLDEDQFHWSDVDVDPQMESTILDAGDYYWECVKSEKIPKFQSPYEFEYIHEVPERLAKMASKFVFVKKMQSLLDKKEASLKNAISEEAARCGVDFETEGKKTRFASIDVVNRKSAKLNVEKLIEEFVKMGGDRTDDNIHVVSKKAKLVEMKGFLKANGSDPKQFVIPGTTKSDPDAIEMEYIKLGGDPNSHDFYKIEKNLDVDLLKTAFRLLGGNLDSEKVTDPSISSTIQLVRVQDRGHQQLQDTMSDLAEVLYEEGLEEVDVLSKDLIKTKENPSYEGDRVPLSEVVHSAEKVQVTDVPVPTELKEKWVGEVVEDDILSF